jgi:hypothetical protein
MGDESLELTVWTPTKVRRAVREATKAAMLSSHVGPTVSYVAQPTSGLEPLEG